MDGWVGGWVGGREGGMDGCGPAHMVCYSVPWAGSGCAFAVSCSAIAVSGWDYVAASACGGSAPPTTYCCVQQAAV